jgi:basic amino acid/polyamine antiporter, APA family
MKLEKKIGLWGGVGIVTGGVIGMGAYALIPGISANAGAGAWLAILVALVVSLIGVLPLIQISSALPVAGAGYLYASRLLHPLAGVLVSFWAILGGSSSLCLVALGLAQYFIEFFPTGLSDFSVAILFIIAFYVVYQFGLKLLASLQIIMSIQMLISLLIFTVVMLNQNNFEIVAGAPTDGFLFAVILAFNVCFGFQIIIELGEEMEHPEKNIPLSLIIGSVVIMVIYLGMLSGYLSEVGVEGALLKPSLASVVKPYFNSFMNAFFIVGVFNAGITSYNAGAIALPREIFSMARDKTLPSFLTKVNAKNGNPENAVNVFFVFVILLLLTAKVLHANGIVAAYFGNAKDNTVEFFGFLTILGIMLLTIFISISAFRLPKVFPEKYAKAYIRFPKWLLNTFIFISVLSSVALITIMCSKAVVAIIYLVYTLAVLVFYFLRKKYLLKQGYQIGKVYDAFSK